MRESSVAIAYFKQRAAWNHWETLFWVLWLAAWFVPSMDHLLLGQVLIWGILALSLDLLLGYRGIPSLGHATFFGIGAYCAGFLGKYGWHEPVSGLLISGLATGAVGLLAGRVIRELKSVALLMVTLSLNMLLYDVVLRSTEITGGDDGLQGVVINPLFGVFHFDLQGRTGYLYSLAVAFILAVFVRVLTYSPWGLALLGARDSAKRMSMLGAPVQGDVTMAFGISAAIAGIAGALMTQTTQFVSPDVMSFQRSADALTILVIGGAGVLYGGFVGALVFMVIRDFLAELNPVYWYFWIGLLLVLIVTFFRVGILPTVRNFWRNRKNLAMKKNRSV